MNTLPEAIAWKPCSVEGCVRKRFANGLCPMHRQRVRSGQPIGGPDPMRVFGLPMSERFWAKVNKGEPDECWTWNGAHHLGYARFNVTRRKPTQASRVAYELAKGPIPEGYQVDHLCRNVGCVNPAHLEAVTPKENVRRATRARGVDTHCSKGHAKTAVGYLKWRRCLECHREREARRYWRKRVAA